MVFLSQKVDRNMIFTDYWKVLVLIFSGMENRDFSWAKKLIERWYLLITEKWFLFWTFPWWKIRSFLSLEVDGKMIFTWFFWAFYDLRGPGKYGFSCSVSFRLFWQLFEMVAIICKLYLEPIWNSTGISFVDLYLRLQILWAAHLYFMCSDNNLALCDIFYWMEFHCHYHY